MPADLDRIGKRPLTVEDGEALWEALRQVSDRLEDLADAVQLAIGALERQIVLTAKQRDGRDRELMLAQLDEARGLLATGDEEDGE